MSEPNKMPLISEGLPSFTNDDFSGAFPASQANDATYGGSHMWRCATTPTGNANEGNLTQAVWWAVDLSTVASGQRQNVLFAWESDAGTGAYDPDLISNNANNLAKDYTIQTNTGAGGGAAPGSGWTTQVTITGNVRHSRQHLVSMAGANWIRINVTAIHGSASNNNVAMKVAVHDGHNGLQDSWIFFGDSITQRGFMHDEQNGFGQIIPKQIAGLKSGYYPYWEGGGIGGWTSTDIQPYFSSWLADFPGRYVGLCFGTNDANLAGTYLTTFQGNMTTMVQAVLGAGKIPVIPHIPWGGTTNLINNVPTLNGQIDTIIAANPGTLAGPNLYTYFSTHQSEIDPTDHIHPTDPALSTGNGYVDYKTQWVNWAMANIYVDPPYTPIANPPVYPYSYYFKGTGNLPLTPPFIAYSMGGTPFDTQPYIATAPMTMAGRTIPAGSIFLLMFVSASSATRTALADGTKGTMTFGLIGNQTATGLVQVSSTLTGSIFQAVVTTLVNIPLN